MFILYILKYALLKIKAVNINELLISYIPGQEEGP